MIGFGQINFEQVFDPLAPQVSAFPGLKNSAIAFGNFESTPSWSTSEIDVIISGLDQTGNTVTRLYDNYGSGEYVCNYPTNFTGVSHGSIAILDYDGNSYTQDDILIVGAPDPNQGLPPINEIYTGTGGFEYTPPTPGVNGVPSNGMFGVSSGSADFIDIDGDNDQDLLITGKPNNGCCLATIFKNNGNGGFSMSQQLDAVWGSSAAILDLDGDNDLDIVYCGMQSTGNLGWKKYLNDGNGNFTISSVGAAPLATMYGSISYADINGDNNQDLLVTGSTGSGSNLSPSTRLYHGDGNGYFTLVPGTIFTDVDHSSSDFIDVDGDNDQDLLITGRDILGDFTTKLYENDGLGNFVEVLGMPFPDIAYGDVDVADVDNDGKPDLLISGEDNSGLYVTNLYRNITEIVGCMNMFACNFNTYATVNDGSCIFPTSSTAFHTTCESYTWIDGVTYTASNNTATHILTNAVGCDSIITLNLIITGNPTVTISQNGTDLEVATAVTYSWNTAETTQTITPTANGWYWCIVTDVNGCIGDTALYEVTNIVSVISETINAKKTLLRITDILGQEIPIRKNTPMFYIYDDGTVEKKVIIE